MNGQPAPVARAVPVRGPTGDVTSTGLSPNLAAALSYLAWWVTGLMFLLLEREDRYVRFHAAQSLVALWALSLFWVGCALLAFVTLLISAWAFRFLLVLSAVTWLAGVVLSLVCLYKAYSGEWWKLPGAGDMAERLEERLRRRRA